MMGCVSCMSALQHVAAVIFLTAAFVYSDNFTEKLRFRDVVLHYQRIHQQNKPDNYKFNPCEVLKEPRTEPLPAEALLVNTLLCRYRRVGTVARPVKDSSRPLQVEFSLRLIQMDVEEKDQALKTSVWARMQWMDEHLMWNASDYGNITDITLPWKDVWVPDVSLVNTADTAVSERHADVMVKEDGEVYWAPHRTFKSACLIDATNYPFDEHDCDMWFQSMSRHTDQLQLSHSEPPLDLKTYINDFKDTQEWYIVRTDAAQFNSSREANVYIKFSMRNALRFTVTVKRRLGYIGHILMMPCVFLSVLTPVVFCLPPDRNDRNTLAMSLFSSFLVLLLVLVEVAPPTAASVPKLAVYYACNMTMTMLAVFLSAASIYISRMGDSRKPPPLWVKKVVIDILARILFMHQKVSEAFLEEADEGKCSAREADGALRPASLLMNKDGHALAMPGDACASAIFERLSREWFQGLDNRMAKLEASVGIMTETTWRLRSREGTRCSIRTKWHNIALVLDRLFLVLCTSTLIISSVLYFPRPI